MTDPFVPGPDAADQHRSVDDDDEPTDPPSLPAEAPEADVLEQLQEVPADDEGRDHPA